MYKDNMQHLEDVLPNEIMLKVYDNGNWRDPVNAILIAARIVIEDAKKEEKSAFEDSMKAQAIKKVIYWQGQ
jgi:hypothetical protein